MGAYFLRRILIAFVVLFGITLIAYTVLSLAPGDPVLARLDPEQLSRMTSAQVDQRRHELGLDQPIPIRYYHWLADVVQGNLGFSIVSGRPIAEEMGPRLLPSLSLLSFAVIVALVVGLPLGILSAVHQYGRSDYLLSAMKARNSMLLALLPGETNSTTATIWPCRWRTAIRSAFRA